MNLCASTVGEYCAGKMADAIKLARKDPVDAEAVCALIQDAFTTFLDYETRTMREQMQAEIDVRQKEIERLQRKLTAPAELF